MSRLRSSALARFRVKGFPTGKNEDWRFTSLTPYTDTHFFLEMVSPDEDHIRQAVADMAIPGLNAYQLVLVNGSIRPDLSVLPDEKLATIQPISEAVSSGVFGEYLHENTYTGSDALLALSTALFTDGCFINIPKEAVVDRPIHILHIYGASGNVFFQPRHLWVVNRHAQATIIEQSVVIKEQSNVSLANSVCRIAVKEDARLTHYELQQNAPGERWLHYSRVSQQRGSRYDNFTFSLPGADLIRNNMEMALDDTATETHLYGLYLVGDNQLTDNHTAIAHGHPACQSNQLYKGVITGNGKAVFNGKVLVSREAQQTNAYQQNNNLLLSGHARVYAKPQLEIYADDVKCSHGCTIGQFHPESLFYLRSRGIDEETARNLLVEAFAHDITDKIEDEPIKLYMQQLIHNSMAAVAAG
jgi:Fe-S cluster assembly protein SufD